MTEVLKLNLKKLNMIQAEKGMTNGEFAKLLNINPMTLCSLKSERRKARLKTVGKIAEALNMAVSDIVL